MGSVSGIIYHISSVIGDVLDHISGTICSVVYDISGIIDHVSYIVSDIVNGVSDIISDTVSGIAAGTGAGIISGVIGHAGIVLVTASGKRESNSNQTTA